MKTYLDSGASTKVDPKILEKMKPYFTQKYGNASSGHSWGQEAKHAMEDARETIAKSIRAKPEEIIFTSGGTESNNFALKSTAFTNREKGNHIITTKIDHDCVLHSCKWLEKQGFKITYLNVDENGFVKTDELQNAITKKTILFSAIHGNNEIGTIQNLKELTKISHEHDVYFHTDACQSYTKTKLDVKEQDLDMATINAHKLNGPKGVGALYIKTGTEIDAWQHGGGHERGMRSSTENIHGIVGFGEAVRIAMKPEHVERMTKLRDNLIKGVLEIPNVELNGPTGNKRLCNNTNFCFQGIEGEALGGYLDLKEIASSTGSACSSHTLEPSHVITAIGRTPEQANSSVRITLSRFTTQEEINYLLQELPGIVTKLRRISPLSKVVDYVLKKSS
ncbi:MAG: cysteine desulfurase [Nanoarchaeota archaeon]|nr:cysteine desulfurase [Nanoarchaeota archaeon]